MQNRRDFLKMCKTVYSNSPSVTISDKKIKSLAATFRQAAAPGWEAYLSTEAKTGAPDMTRIFFELALICAQQGGFIYEDADGRPQKWNLNGSGAAAMVAKFDEIRSAKALPGIDKKDVAEMINALAPLFADVPFTPERMAMFAEFASPAVYADLQKMIEDRRGADGSYTLDFNFAQGVAALFPQSFGSDPFRKKVFLAVMMTAAHAESRGVTVRTDVPVAADYVLPQVLEGLGILKFDKTLSQKLSAREAFPAHSEYPRTLRSATILACEKLVKASGARPQDIDGFLWLAGRDPAIKAKLKPAMNVYTTWF